MRDVDMAMAVASTKAVDAIGKDDAERIFHCIIDGTRATGKDLLNVARLADAIGEDVAREIFERLV